MNKELERWYGCFCKTMKENDKNSTYDEILKDSFNFQHCIEIIIDSLKNTIESLDEIGDKEEYIFYKNKLKEVEKFYYSNF